VSTIYEITYVPGDEIPSGEKLKLVGSDANIYQKCLIIFNEKILNRKFSIRL
jgi:hypothetical protein